MDWGCSLPTEMRNRDKIFVEKSEGKAYLTLWHTDVTTVVVEMEQCILCFFHIISQTARLSEKIY
jgi:hypothetical protein